MTIRYYDIKIYLFDNQINKKYFHYFLWKLLFMLKKMYNFAERKCYSMVAGKFIGFLKAQVAFIQRFTVFVRESIVFYLHVCFYTNNPVLLPKPLLKWILSLYN